MRANELMEKLQQTLEPGTVYGKAVERDDVTVIPVARVRGGGGGGGDNQDNGGAGYGVDARVTGAFVVREGTVRWVPAVDVNKIVLGGQAVAIAALLVLRRAIKKRGRQRGGRRS